MELLEPEQSLVAQLFVPSLCGGRAFDFACASSCLGSFEVPPVEPLHEAEGKHVRCVSATDD